MSRHATARRTTQRPAHARLQRTAVPRGPRRVSGPAAPARRSPAPRPARAEGLAVAEVLRAGAARALTGRPRPVPVRLPRPVRTLPDHGFLDTLLRSRAWIWLIGLLLGGIVAMQVTLLKLNGEIGRAVATTAAYEQRNADLEATIARLSSGERIRAAAERSGMVMPDAGTIRFLDIRPGDAARAARRMQPPSQQALALAAGGGSATATAPAATTEPATTATPTVAPAPTATSTPAPVASPAPTPAPTTTTTTTAATGAAPAHVHGEG